MTDEEKAEEYFCEHCENSFEHNNGHCSNCSKWDYFIVGLKEGRKEKWHDLRENPNDLPKCTENEQIIFYVKEYYKSIGKIINHFCLGVYRKSFMDDDVKLFVEKSKGYECEHSTEDVLRWCELPKFEED